MLLVRSINEFPQPIAYKTHKVGLKMVKDLTIARRFIMQKLAVGMLNIVDQFHAEVCNLVLIFYFLHFFDRNFCISSALRLQFLAWSFLLEIYSNLCRL